MAVTALIIGMIGVCICWLPGVGWLGVACGLTSGVLAVPSITHFHERPGYTGWGVAGIFLSIAASSLGLAYQVKHMSGALDALVVPLPVPLAYYVLGGGGVLIIIGLVLARTKARLPGAIIAGLALAATIVVASWSLTTADRALTAETAPTNQND